MEESTTESIIGNLEMEPWEAPFKRMLGCLLQTAMVSARNGFPEEAEAILASVAGVRPTHPSPKFARALIHIYNSEHQVAIDMLNEEILKDDPENEMARVITCMALHMMERGDECFTVVRHLLHNGKNEQAKSIARTLAADLNFPL